MMQELMLIWNAQGEESSSMEGFWLTMETHTREDPYEEKEEKEINILESFF